jgi:predicted hydrolase (HD superfamily)
MTRNEAYKLLTEMMQNQNLIKHGLAVEAIMRALCHELRNRHPELVSGSPEEFNEEEWGIVGLLHDADYEVIEKNPDRHTLVTEEKLRPLGVSDRIINGIKAHHDHIKPQRDNWMEKAVYAADDTSGLITAMALVKDRKLANVTVENLMKKFDQKNFAAGAKREQISKGVEELGITMNEFLAISLRAMQNISNELGL